MHSQIIEPQEVLPRLSVGWCGLAGVQDQLDEVFDRAPDEGPDIALEGWWTSGEPVEGRAVIDQEFWFDWLSHRDELAHRRALYVTDVPIDPDLEGRFAVRRNVLAVRPGRSSRVLVSYESNPSHLLAVSRLWTSALFLSV